MKKTRLKKSILGKLIGSFVIFCLLFTLTFAIDLVIEAMLLTGDSFFEDVNPFAHADDNGNIFNLESVTNFGGWVEELDENNCVIKIYGEKRNTADTYSADDIYDLISITSENEFIGFIIKPKNYANHYLFLYSRERFQFSPTVIINKDQGTVSYNQSSIFGFLFIFTVLMEIVCISIYLRRKIKRPLSQLTQGMERIQSGEENVFLDIKTEAEFEQIVAAFNAMTKELENQKSENRRLVEQKNRLLLDLSHDLRTPIATIKSCANALEAGLVPDGKLQSYYKTIELKANRIQILSEDMFFMLKADSGNDRLNTENTDICEFLRKLCAEYYDELESAGFDFEIDIPDEPHNISIDKQLFARVIGNLLTNAEKYNTAGKIIGISCMNDPEHCVIDVLDDGEKIDDALSVLMFAPFTRGDKTRSSIGGTGLGLSISKMIVEKHGGTLKYIREKDKNVFEIVLKEKYRVNYNTAKYPLQ